MNCPVTDALNHLSNADPVLAQLIKTHPEPAFVAHTNYYEELVSSIISQQLSVKAAKAIQQRFMKLFDGTLPTPEQIVAANSEELRGVGLSRPKVSYIQDLAQKIMDSDVAFEGIEQLENLTIIKELTSVKGIGEWTVHMFLMFCMGRLDVLPHGDLGIRNGITILYGFETTATSEDVKQIAIKNNWHPYESVASHYVWESLENFPR
jgi:DNA-3-methyladenine glycosylase II